MPIREEPYELQSLDTTLIPAANRSDGTANKWIEIWKYQVPTGIGHVLRASHTFSAYLEDATAQVGNGTCQVRIAVKDPTEQDARMVLGPALYMTIKEFQDQDKLAHLNLSAPVKVLERWWIIIEVKDDGAIDESDSYFALRINRIRESL